MPDYSLSRFMMACALYVIALAQAHQCTRTTTTECKCICEGR